ncbi:uncharacterized protein LOC116174613 [Photinus pyralis]|uniref:uncharacterized protein LOC116174613 n=1 Tax=Photinus pyralis TaxID=7054 RepID=UPI0012674884|nr:uncharacterized protein LOC116174613 [Photinus pyralis]
MSIKSQVEAKIEDFDVQGAIRILSSDEKLAPFDKNTLDSLATKHPAPSRDLSFPDPPDGSLEHYPLIEHEIQKSINSFPAGSSPGIDGLRPQFLKDIISKSAGDAGKRVLTAITKLCNFMLDGKVHPEILPILYGATLCALHKKDGGIRPIAVGNTLRRLVGHTACTKSNEQIQKRLAPHQVGVATKRGCESAVHSIRTYVNNPANSEKVLLKIDFRNAFNNIERDNMLEEFKSFVPELYPLMYQCYRQPTLLFYDKTTILSQRGAQQGDPCGPLGFSLTVQPLVEQMTSELNVWYLDDASLADNFKTVLADFINLLKLANERGLEINTGKCELFFCNGYVNEIVLRSFQQICPGIRLVTCHDLEILGSPIFEEAYSNCFMKKLHQLQCLTDRLSGINTHIAYFLLLWNFPQMLISFDDLLRSSFTNVLNMNINDDEWRQATLPVIDGGTGLRKICDIALPCFLSSTYGAQTLASQILPHMDGQFPVHLQADALTAWIQGALSGAWLQCIPSANIGTMLDSQDFETCMALRLGCKRFQKHQCNCGKVVEENGHHGLSCLSSKGRLSRHTELNHIIQRALASIKICSILEPVGLSRDDGKRPDGVSLAPWRRGQRLIWDVTCVDTVTASYIHQTSITAGSASEIQAKKKHEKYSDLKSNNFFIVALAFETFGPCSSETTSFLMCIGQNLIAESGDSRAKSFLFQRISLAIQRGNAASIRGTLPDHPGMDEIFSL